MATFVRPRSQFRRIRRYTPATRDTAPPLRGFLQPPVYHRPYITRRAMATMLNTVYSIPRDHVVFIDPIVIEFTVVDPLIRRTGGHVAGGDIVRPVGARTVRPVD